MSACETCWTEASFRSRLGQGFTAELYKEELEAHPEHEIKVGDIVSANLREKHPLSWLVIEIDEKNQLARLRSGQTGYRKWFPLDRIEHWKQDA